jgi:hypothetical protein
LSIEETWDAIATDSTLVSYSTIFRLAKMALDPSSLQSKMPFSE